MFVKIFPAFMSIASKCFYLHRKKPSFLEYLSYHLNFMSVLAGPCSNFQDYIAFIEGRHIQSKLLNSKANGYTKLPNPSPNVST
ncbi:hypothetical protein XELAEV_18000386mg [Xenopus laevis]|uniref:Uncharacterized protein n=1 Tax=Xenopus laevis TaxID=8355 RepID=A0A974GYT9_XENLA|nr:hypothetical protein XELAEV_18000386mg [Xenopus laevis]